MSHAYKLDEPKIIPFRNPHHFASKILQTNGVRLNDNLTIMPMQGRKKTFTLTRTHYHITCEKGFLCQTNGTRISFPSFSDEESAFSLSLCSNGNSGLINDVTARYILKAEGHQPFRLNGNFCYEAFPARGDQIDFGYNRIIIHDQSLQEADDQDISIPTSTAESELNILIEGETGTGKTRLAKKIHDQSGRLGKFVHINLSSFSENLIESELFGHIKGAFTGAINSKKGAFQEANRGTLFLDEIDSLPWNIQTKLLLFLDSKEVRAVGSEQTEKCNVRIIFASGKKLSSLVSSNAMRRDFYFRITSGFSLELPPLRKDQQLLENICLQFACEHNLDISQNLISHYQNLPWPGNIRQLLGHLEKKSIMTKGRKLIFDETDEQLMQQKELISPIEDDVPNITMEDMKIDYANRIFRRFKGNIKKSSKVLNITPNTLRAILRKGDIIPINRPG